MIVVHLRGLDVSLSNSNGTVEKWEKDSTSKLDEHNRFTQSWEL